MKNVGNTDTILRFILATAISTSGVLFHSWWGLAAAIPLATGLAGFCPLYSVFGWNTCSQTSNS